MDKELKALLERFKCEEGCDELSLAELSDLRGRLTEWQAELEETGSDESLATIGKLATIVASVDAQVATVKAEFAAKVAKTKEAALADFAHPATEDTVVDEGEAVDKNAVDAVAKATDVEDDFSISDYEPPKRPQIAPEATNDDKVTGKVMVSQARDADGNTVFGGLVTSSVELSQKLAEAVDVFGTQTFGRVPVVRGTYSSDNFQVIGPGDDEFSTTVKMLKAVEEFNQKQADWLTADGSFCAPVSPDYSFCDLADSDHDLFQASLPVVRPTRGRVQYMVTPTNDQFFDGWGGVDSDAFVGVGTHFDEDDSIAVDPADSATWKGLVQVDCPEQGPTAELSAHYTNIQWKHFTWKAYPEYIDLYTRKALQAHQLKESLRLLQTVRALGQTVPQIDAFPGSVTGFFSALDIHASAYRDAYWLPRDLVLDIVLPRWVLNMLRAALARRADDSEIEALRATDALITSLFSSLGLRVNFVAGWQRLATSTDGAGNEVDPVLPATGDNTWPSTFSASLWVPGAVVLLEDPSWNIGIERLRDTTLQRQNAYSLFVETFNGIASPCPYPVQNLTVGFCPTGASSARETLACSDLVTAVGGSS